MRFISILFLMMFAVSQAFAIGNISGKVSDGKNGETIIGATVMVKGTTRGTQTDVDGNFNLSVDAGTYTLEIKYLGYQTKEVSDVVVTDNNTVSINTTITESKATELQEVVVKSSLKKENISSLYIIQKNSAAISDGISADIIKKSPDRSTGEVLKRVSGTTIQDNKFVIIRGLSDRYNLGMVDNAILPSTEPNRKAFSFDIIPSSLVDNIIITKAATPDLPGDFAGGVINILTKEIPEQNFTNISIGTSYNTVSTFKDFKSGYRGSTDFLGFDDGSRKLPKDIPSTATIGSGLTTQQNIDNLSKLNNDYSINTHSAMPGINLQASSGKVFALKGNKRIGIVGAVNYAHTEMIEQNVERYYSDYDYKDNTYKYSSNLGALLNVGYSSAKSKITLKSLYNNIFDDNFLDRSGFNWAKTRGIQYYAYDLQQKSLFKTSLEGDHRVGTGQSKFNWLLGYNHVGNLQPDQRKLQYTLSDVDNTPVADIETLGKLNNRLYSKLSENIYSANINYSMPVSLFNKTTIKAGVFGQYRQRDFNARFLGLQLRPVADAEQIKRLKPADLFSQQLINANAYLLQDQTIGADAYDANSTTAAGYVMIDNKFTEKLRLVWGARVESFNVKLNSFNTNNAPVAVDQTWTDLLPSANLTYSLSDKINLRGSYYRTVARPEFREMAPFAYFDYELSALNYGTPGLQRSQINNADLRFEYYPAAGEILSASIFYKHFNKTIEPYVLIPSSQMEIYTRNYDQAQNIGAEIEIRKNLGFINDGNRFLRNLTFYTNLAFIKSRVTGNDTSTFGVITEIDRPLSGQSNYVINGGLSYAAMQGKLNVNVLYNRIGQRITLVGAIDPSHKLLGNVWEMPRNVLDAQVAYNISKRSELKLNVKDLLNAKYMFYFDQNRNDKFDGMPVKEEGAGPNPANDMILKTFRPGTTFSLTYTYKF